MLVSYFDESGHSQQTAFVSMAGCVGRWDQWREFNSRWTAALERNGAPYLHMREFAHSIGPYKGWSEGQRRTLMSDCLSALDGSRIVICAAALRVADFMGLEPEVRADIADPYYACFQECVYGMELAAYIGFPGDRVNIIYSQQDEFRTSFRKIFDLMKATAPDGRRLGVLRFHDMRDSPGLQLADLGAYELRHHYQLKQDKPGVPVRYPFRFICEHQVGLKGGLFKFLPKWLLRLKVTGGSAEVLRVLFADPETWRPLLDQLAPEPVRLAERAKRISLGYQRGILDALRGWKYHSDYDPESK